MSADRSRPGTSRGARRLLRSRDDRRLGGVCGGAAACSGLDPTMVRVLLVVATLLGAGALALAYFVAWALVPLG